MGETCCCGFCTVETGTIYIAILNIIGSLFSITKYMVNLNTMIKYPEEVPYNAFPGFEENQAIYISLYIGASIMTIVYGALSGLLLVGTRAKNHRQCVPWLYWNYISIGCLTLFVILMSIVIAAAGQLAEGFGTLVFGGAFIAISIYFVNVVQRFVVELRAA